MGENTRQHVRIQETSPLGSATTTNHEDADTETRPLITSSSPTTTAATPSPPPPPQKPLTLLNGLALVIALQIGSGIFTLPTQVSQSVPSPGAGLLVWLLAGLLVWTGAASFIELGCRAPSNGGIQEYVRVAYGNAKGGGYDDGGSDEEEQGGDGSERDEEVGTAQRGPDTAGGLMSQAAAATPTGSHDDKVGPRGELAGFVFTWTWVILAKPAANGAISTIAANYLSRPFLPGAPEAVLSPLAGRLTALACVGALTAVNCLGATSGAKAANVFLMLKLSALGSIILVGLFALVTGWRADGVPASGTGWFGWSAEDRGKPAWQLLGDFVTATFGAVFCYGGWETVRNHPTPTEMELLGTQGHFETVTSTSGGRDGVTVPF